MKKLLTLLMMAAFSFMIISCDTRDDRVDQDTYSVVYDLANVDFIFSAADGYTISRTMNIYNSDVLLMYRRAGTTTTGEPVNCREFSQDEAGKVPSNPRRNC